MDNELDQLEAELKGLQPATPSHEIAARIERDLAARYAPRRSVDVRWLWAFALPAAAAFALMIMQTSTPRHQGEKPIAPPVAASDSAATKARDAAELKPVTDENVLVSARDEGLVTLEDGTPARRERLQYVETITWKNPRTKASLTWSLPREEVRVVPISFQ